MAKLKTVYIVKNDIIDEVKYPDRVFKSFKAADKYALKLIQTFRENIKQNKFVNDIEKSKSISKRIGGYYSFYGRKSEVDVAYMYY